MATVTARCRVWLRSRLIVIPARLSAFSRRAAAVLEWSRAIYAAYLTFGEGGRACLAALAVLGNACETVADWRVVRRTDSDKKVNGVALDIRDTNRLSDGVFVTWAASGATVSGSNAVTRRSILGTIQTLRRGLRDSERRCRR